jgi:alpha-1,3-rhamnosyl/mannosyltransferase
VGSDVRVLHNLPENFILFVGSIEPRKNLKALLPAYQELEGSLRKEYKLMLAGFQGWENDEVMKQIRDLKANSLYIGYVPENELAKIYNLASLAVYPPLYEGIGLSPLEAMACGCPVVVSNVASLPEVCGDAAYYADPLNPNSIGEAIGQVLRDNCLRNALVQKGIERASSFNWKKTAQQHLRVFEEALSS